MPGLFGSFALLYRSPAPPSGRQCVFTEPVLKGGYGECHGNHLKCLGFIGFYDPAAYPFDFRE